MFSIRVAIPAMHHRRPDLLARDVCTADSLGLEQGHSDASCIAYVSSACWRTHFGEYRGRLPLRHGLAMNWSNGPDCSAFKLRTYHPFGDRVMPWTQHVRTGRDLLNRGFDVASRVGEVTYAGYTCDPLTTNFLMAGDPLIETQRAGRDTGLKLRSRVGFARSRPGLLRQLGLVRSCAGSRAGLARFDDEQFDEREFERRSWPAIRIGAGRNAGTTIRKLQARFFAGDYVDAIEAASRAQPTALDVARFFWTSWNTTSTLRLPGPRPAILPSRGPRQHHSSASGGHHRAARHLGTNCPENFANRAALVGAEIARIEGRDADAMRLYEQAIRSAREHGFVQNEGAGL